MRREVWDPSDGKEAGHTRRLLYARKHANICSNMDCICKKYAICTQYAIVCSIHVFMCTPLNMQSRENMQKICYKYAKIWIVYSKMSTENMQKYATKYAKQYRASSWKSIFRIFCIQMHSSLCQADVRDETRRRWRLDSGSIVALRSQVNSAFTPIV